jgi:hypothetical protein
MASSYRSCTPRYISYGVRWLAGASPGAGIIGATRTSSSTATLSQTSGALPGATSAMSRESAFGLPGSRAG